MHRARAVALAAVLIGSAVAASVVSVVRDATPAGAVGVNGYAVGYRDIAGTQLRDLFDGNAHVESDASFSAPAATPATGRSHVETSTVFFLGKYYMYYRYFLPDGAPCNVPNGNMAIGLLTSTDGKNFAPPAGVTQPVLKLAGQRVYGPSVMLDTDALGRARLSMAVERTTGANCNAPWEIGRSYSTDGVTWGAVSALVQKGGASPGLGVGTPSLLRTPDGTYRVMYHDDLGTGPLGRITRDVANGATLDVAMVAKQHNVLGNPNWGNSGMGRGDVVHEGAYWYTVVEGLRNVPTCSRDEISSWGIYRTTDATLRTGWQASTYNPVRIDRIGRACGEDMPVFQVIASTAYVITTGEDVTSDDSGTTRNRLQRYKIVAGTPGRSGQRFVGIAATSTTAYDLVTAYGTVYAAGPGAIWPGNANIPDGSAIGIAAVGGRAWIAHSNGTVDALNGACCGHGTIPLNKPIVTIVVTPSGNGYYLVASDGGLFTYGDAVFRGSLGGCRLNEAVAGMALTNSGNGYWFVAADGGVFTSQPIQGGGCNGTVFGDAQFYGALGQHLNQPVIGMIRAGTTNGAGYYLLAKDGGVFSFGPDAPFRGGTAGLPADLMSIGQCVANGASAPTNPPACAWATGIATYPGTQGYWMTFLDGGIGNFDAPFLDSPRFVG